MQIRNSSGADMTSSVAVAISGWDSTNKRYTVELADNSTSTLFPAIGILPVPVANNTNGYVAGMDEVVFYDTSGDVVGDIYYLGTAGAITKTPPTGSALVQPVARVITVGANGRLMVLALSQVSPHDHTVAQQGGVIDGIVALSTTFTTSNTTLQDITGFAFSVSASTEYLFEAWIRYSADLTSTGIDIGLTGPATPGFLIGNWVSYEGTVGTIAGRMISGYGSVGSLTASGDNNNNFVYISGIFYNGANDGTLQFQAASETNLGLIDIQPGSIIKWRKVQG